MRRLFRPRFGAFVLALLTLAATSKPRTTADGLSYPQAEDRRVEFDLPLVHKWLDALPEEVTTTRIYSIDSTVPVVAQWRQKMDQQHADYSDYEYITNGLSGSDATVIHVSNGRVQRVGLLYPHLTPEKLQSMVGPFEKAGTLPRSTSASFRITKSGVRVIGVLSGEHKNFQSTPIQLQDFNGHRTGGVKSDTYFSFLEIGIHRIDWYVMHHDLTKEVAAAIATGHLAKGMTEDEARMLLGAPAEVTTNERGGRELYWHVTETTASGAESEVRVTATIVGGKVESFEDHRTDTDDDLR
jgi:hypothetical protein